MPWAWRFTNALQSSHGAPARIPNWLRCEQTTVYFITFCVRPRNSVLANARAWQICQDILKCLDQWHVLAAIAMPDHLHVLAAPGRDRETSVSAFSSGSNVGLTRLIGPLNDVIVGRLCQTAARLTYGVGRRDVSTGSCARTNRFRINGNISGRTRYVRALYLLPKTGRTNSPSIQMTRNCRASVSDATAGAIQTRLAFHRNALQSCSRTRRCLACARRE